MTHDVEALARGLDALVQAAVSAHFDAQPIRAADINWLVVSKLAEATGLSEKAPRRRIEKGI